MSSLDLKVIDEARTRIIQRLNALLDGESSLLHVAYDICDAWEDARITDPELYLLFSGGIAVDCDGLMSKASKIDWAYRTLEERRSQLGAFRTRLEAAGDLQLDV